MFGLPITRTQPALSIGNMGQLAVDLLISSSRARRVAYLDEPSVLPCAGNDAFGPDAVGDLALALEGWVLDPCCHSVLFLPRILRTLSDLLLAFLMLPVSLFHEHQLFDEIY